MIIMTTSQDIQKEILKAKGIISFASFMELALYHPESGYYNADNFELGQHGDFTTAAEISPLFAKCLARQIQQINEEMPSSSILELGAGSGRLAHDLLTELESLNCLPDQYYIYEISPGLRKKQRALLQASLPQLSSRIIWLDTLPENFSGTIIANEVLDALPVHCFRIEDNKVWEKCVAFENQQFVFKLRESFSEEALRIKEEYALPEGYEFEINFKLKAFLEVLSRCLKKGMILFSDYGYGQKEYYHPERRLGTLCCFYQHRQDSNPLLLPGQKDITAHVDFTRVIDLASDAGFTLQGFTSQACFLLGCGLSTYVMEAEKTLAQAEQVNLHHAVKILTLPTEMGERVKFMALGKEMEMRLMGFEMQDRRREL